jgi:hypothetical protein
MEVLLPVAALAIWLLLAHWRIDDLEERVTKLESSPTEPRL